MKRISALNLVFSLILFAAGGWAQGLSTILGTVTDPSGAVVPQARVTVTEVGTGFNRTVRTDAQGAGSFDASQTGGGPPGFLFMVILRYDVI